MAPTLTGATLLTIGLSGVTAATSSGGFGISVGGGSIGLAILEPAVPASGTDSRYWLAVVASGLSGSLSLGGVSASVQGVSVAINTQAGTDPNNNPAGPLNWTTFSPAVSPISGLTVQSTGDGFSVTGALTNLNIDNVVNASASFALSDSTVNAMAGNTTLNGATLLTLGLSGLTASAGSGGFGVSVGGGSIGVALLEPPAPASGTDSRYWVAVMASGLSGSLSLGSSVSASVQNGAIAINQAGGTDPNGHAATPLNWAADLDLNDDGQFGTSADQVNPLSLIAAAATAPVANAARFSVLEDQGLNIAAPGLLPSGQGLTGSSVALDLVAGPAHDASFQLNQDGSFVYTPANGFTGTDTFTYDLQADGLTSNVATVTINVVAGSQAPTVNDQYYTSYANSSLIVAKPGVLMTATGTSGHSLTPAVVTGPAHGTLTLNPDGSFSYSPVSGFNGTDSFTYDVSDGTSTSPAPPSRSPWIRARSSSALPC